jgi:hypothetical protein
MELALCLWLQKLCRALLHRGWKGPWWPIVPGWGFSQCHLGFKRKTTPKKPGRSGAHLLLRLSPRTTHDFFLWLVWQLLPQLRWLALGVKRNYHRRLTALSTLEVAFVYRLTWKQHSPVDLPIVLKCSFPFHSLMTPPTTFSLLHGFTWGSLFSSLKCLYFAKS